MLVWTLFGIHSLWLCTFLQCLQRLLRLLQRIDTCKIIGKGGTWVSRGLTHFFIQGSVSCRVDFYRIQKNEKCLMQCSSLLSHLGDPFCASDSSSLSIECLLGRLRLYKYTHNNNNQTKGWLNNSSSFSTTPALTFNWVIVYLESDFSRLHNWSASQ